MTNRSKWHPISWNIRALRALASLVIAAAGAYGGPINAQVTADEQSVRKLVADFTAAINRGDARAFATLFTADADFVVITGKYLQGRDEIVTYHAALFTGAFQGSQLVVTSTAVRFLRPDVAVARVATRRNANGDNELRTSFPMFVLTKEHNSWLIAAVQNTLTSGPPAVPAGAPR